MKRISRKRIRYANRHRKASSLEVLVAGRLQELGIPFKREYALGQCHVDFAVPAPQLPKGQLLVEINGCYFHGCMRCFPTQHKKRAARARERDRRRYTFFHSRGYALLVLWGCDVNDNLVREVRKITNIVRNRGQARLMLWKPEES